jgi:hypothetical protein
MDNGIVNIHGREYKTVALRVSEFRQAHPDWTITCDILERNETVVVVKASIIDNNGRLIATGHAEEFRADGKINRTSALENAESSAVGRCLAFYGLGGSELASADEVARAVSGQKPAAPNPLEQAEKWGLLNAVEIERAGFGAQWQKALSGARLDELRKINAQVMEATK